MATRIQTRYESAGLFVGPSPATGRHFAAGLYGNPNLFSGSSGDNLIRPLFRVQSFSDSFDNPLQNVNQLGQATTLAKVATSAPTPTFDFTYFTNNGLNEAILGFPVKLVEGLVPGNVSGLRNCLSGFFDSTNDSKNYFAQFVPEGKSVYGSTADDALDYIVCLSNGFITNYEVSASVGGFMESTVSVEGSNYVVNSNSTGNVSPAIFPENGEKVTGWQYDIPTISQDSTGAFAGAGSTMPAVIKQGGIRLNISNLSGNMGVNISESNINSFSVSIPVARDNLERLGSQFVFARPLQTPIDATVSFDFSVTDMATGSLVDLFNGTSLTEFDFSIVTAGSTGNSIATDQFAIVVRGATFESENTSLDIGSARNGSVTFQVPLGTVDETGKGIFFSGAVSQAEISSYYAGRA
jgi:hypothetical protein